MKICIFGAGAIGGYLGVQFARAGADVSLVARGAYLAAMRANGLKLLIGDEEHVVHPRCTDNARELPPQDFVIICLKAHSITGAIEAMRPLLGARTRIVTAVNGIPYWYFYRHGGRYEGSTIESIDPGGRQWRELGPERAAPSTPPPMPACSIRPRARRRFWCRLPITTGSWDSVFLIAAGANILASLLAILALKPWRRNVIAAQQA